METVIKKNAVCSTCTIKLVNIAYQRQPWFRLLREPLKMGMQFFAWLYRVDPNLYEVRTPACYRCLRFSKLALKEKSATFRWLNDRINPLFDAWLDRIISEQEMQQAKSFARKASAGEIPPDEA